MKTSKVLLPVLLCLFAVFAFCLVGCAPDIGTLSEKEISDIRKDYFEILVADAAKHGNTIPDEEIDKIVVQKYLGTYNGYIVIKLRNYITPGPAVAADVVIGGITIGKNIDASVSFYAYKPEQKTFTELSAAYDAGYVSKGDLKTIASAEKAT